jgi:hypothetical protein
LTPRLLSLFVRYGTASHGRRDGIVSTVSDLHQHYHERRIAIPRTIVIDNARAPDAGTEDWGSHWVVPGDNTHSEFSAWDRGLAFARELGLDYDVLHLATSTFHSGYAEYTRYVEARILELMARTPLCVGHIDTYNEPVELFGRRSQHWIRTSYFFLSRSVVDRLGTLVSIDTPEALLADRADDVLRADAPISESYRRTLLDWLTGDDVGQGQVWHSGLSDVRDNLSDARRKVLAIVNEHMLSVRLREADVRTLDAIWLGHNFRRVVPLLLLADWRPDWRHQLHERGVGALALRAGAALHFEARAHTRGRNWA